MIKLGKYLFTIEIIENDGHYEKILFNEGFNTDHIWVIQNKLDEIIKKLREYDIKEKGKKYINVNEIKKND